MNADTDGILVLRDWVTGQRRTYSLETVRCECCDAPHDPRDRRTKLVLDHTWRPDGTYLLSVLCGHCNVRKQDFPWVSFGDRCWWPGMPPKTLVRKPRLGFALCTSNLYGVIRVGRVLKPPPTSTPGTTRRAPASSAYRAAPGSPGTTFRSNPIRLRTRSNAQ